MSKPELNELIKHYGVKGMKWDVHRDPEEIKADIKNGINAVGDTLDDTVARASGQDMVKEQLDDVINDIFKGDSYMLKRDFKQLQKEANKKMSKISNNIKERGSKFLTKLFGPA